MTISELSVRKPVTITMIYVLICVIAFVFLSRLGIALFPETTWPVLSVSTTYENVGPEEIDETVTKVLVNQLVRVPNVKKVTSVSSAGSSRVTLEFGYDIDIDEAMDNVQSQISSVQRRLPDDCNSPAVRKFDSSAMPFMRLALRGNLPRNELADIAEDTVEPYLERISGVASADTWGSANKNIYVDVSPNRLGAYGTSLSAVSSALAARNIQLSGGSITQGQNELEVVTEAYYRSLDEIRDTILTTYSDGTMVRVSDIAAVSEDFDTTGRKIFINGIQGMYLAVSRETDANMSSVAAEIREVLPEINSSLPEGVSLEIMSDDSTMIDSTMKEVYNSAIQGVILAVIIIFLFLRSFKSSFIIGLSIPISILITLMVMAMLDLTVNIMTMAGIILALGMTVDSSIVILENIQRYRLKGDKPAVAAIRGSSNMMTAIIASTLTTLCVFIPILIYRAELEQMGQMFQELVLTVVAALVASLFVAVTLVPALCGSILKLNTKTQKPLRKGTFKYAVDNVMERILAAIERGYLKTLKLAMRNKLQTVALFVVLILLSIVTLTNKGISLSPPSSTDDQVSMSVTLPIGTDNDVVLRYLFELQENILSELQPGDYESIIINSGTSNSGEVQINLPDITEQSISPADIRKKLLPYTRQWAEATVTFSSGRRMGGSSNAIDVILKSDNPQNVLQTAEEIVAVLKEKAPQLRDIETDMENGAPKYDLIIDKDAAGAYGVSISTVAQTLRTALTGSTATIFRADGDETDIIVRITENEMQTAADITALTVPTSAGLIPLDNFVTLQNSRSPQQIQREDRERLNHVTAALEDGYAATTVQPIVRELIENNVIIPADVQVSYGGEAADIAKFGGSFVVVILLAFFLVFAVMAAQFESLIDPFIIFTTIPTVIIGVAAVYQITGAIFNMYSIVGIVALVGIVVNNGIILVDYTNQLTADKMPVYEACVTAAQSRLKPILMTTLTTILGMIPMGFFPGEGGEQMQPIGMTIVGGLASGAFCTLYLAPVMYMVLNRRREKRFSDPESLSNQLEAYDNGIMVQ